MIEEYHFGSVTIDGKKYNHDLEIRWMFSKTEVLEWERDESHIIDVEDVKRAVEQKPDTIVIGTGESGKAEVTEPAKQFIAKKGIKLIIDITEEAVRIFNEGEQTNVIGLFHLTC